MNIIRRNINEKEYYRLVLLNWLDYVWFFAYLLPLSLSLSSAAVLWPSRKMFQNFFFRNIFLRVCSYQFNVEIHVRTDKIFCCFFCVSNVHRFALKLKFLKDNTKESEYVCSLWTASEYPKLLIMNHAKQQKARSYNTQLLCVKLIC